MAANNFINGGTNNNWAQANNWSTGVIPASGDGNVATFTASSPNCNIGAAVYCNAIDFTNYTNTITMAGNLIAIYGNVTLGVGMHVTTPGLLYIAATSSIKSNGFIWSGQLYGAGAGTITLLDNWTVTGLVTINNNAFNGNTLYCNGGLSHLGSSGAATTNLIIGGVWTSAGVGYIRNPITLASGSTISGVVYYLGNTLSASSTNVTTTGSILVLGSTSLVATLDLNGLVLNTLYISSTSGNITLNSGFGISGNLYNGDVATHVKILSSVGGTKRAITLSPSATMNLDKVDFTDIDASGGQTIQSFRGVVSNCLNVVPMTTKLTRAY